VLTAHDKGRHDACSPLGCDDAFDAAIDRIMADGRLAVMA
jgi:hypothetical protein